MRSINVMTEIVVLTVKLTFRFIPEKSAPCLKMTAVTRMKVVGLDNKFILNMDYTMESRFLAQTSPLSSTV
jgi:hypothetical protein